MKTKLIDRSKRFFKALVAKIEKPDLEIINEILDQKQQELFFSMSIIDQRHCLDVTKTLLTSDKKPSIETLKLALLHDIGKQVKPFYLLERVVVVLLPRKKLNIPIRPLEDDLLKKAWQLKYWHPEYGAELAEKKGLDHKMIELIRNHHNSDTKFEEIKIFQWADNLN